MKIEITKKDTGKTAEIIKKAVPMRMRPNRVAMGGGGKKKKK